MAPSIFNDFVNWDDEAYILDNVLIQELSLRQIGHMFTTLEVEGNYHPITLLSLAIDYAIGGGAPLPFHFTNFLLHLLNTFLCGYFMLLLTGKQRVALVGMLLMGIHPMHVESVAWISSRKDVLYAFFFLAGLISYLFYLKKKPQRRLYLSLTILFFILSLLSKSMAITFPLVLMLIDVWKKPAPIARLIRPKIPWLLLSLAFAALTYYSQAAGAALEFVPDRHPLNTPFIVSYSLLFYLVKSLMPLQLAAFHPYPGELTGMLPFYFYLSFLILIALSGLIWIKRKRYPALWWGMSFFVLNLLAVIQLVPVGQVVAAERYTYIAYVGIFFILGFGVNEMWEQSKKLASWQRGSLMVLGLTVTSLLIFQSFQRAKVWKNGDTLWSDVIEKYPHDFCAYGCRGNYHIQTGNYAQALRICLNQFRHNLAKMILMNMS